MATALLALLAFAPLASATPDPVASGTTTLKLNQKLKKELQQFGIKLSALKPAKLKGRTATFKVTGGSFDPTTNKGSLTHSGGLKVKWGKTSVAIRKLELNTSKKGLFGKVAGKKMKIASLAGTKFARQGFGVKATIKKLRLTANFAVKLDKKLNPAHPAKSKGHKKGKKGASKSDAIPVPFKANALLGSAKSSEQPSTTTLVPGGNLTLALNSDLATKLSNAQVKIETLSGTTTLPGNTYSFPITGGNFASTGTAGVVQSGGGLSLVQKLSIAGKSLDTNITLGSVWYDLQAKTISVEVSATSTASKDLNLGSLGRSSVADVTIGGVIADPKTRSVAVQNSSAVLQVVSGEVLNGFVKVYAEYTKGSKELEALKLKEEAEKLAAEALQLGAEAKLAGEEALKLGGEGKLAEALAKQAEAEAKKVAAEAKGALALEKKAAAEA
ncbi:MAG TPA: hypothetical protein VEB65_00460, partial [Solirubrobacterales bacterium]|nr:hypothetical protein [Solirubrobacterales bacterium]